MAVLVIARRQDNLAMTVFYRVNKQCPQYFPTLSFRQEVGMNTGLRRISPLLQGLVVFLFFQFFFSADDLSSLRQHGLQSFLFFPKDLPWPLLPLMGKGCSCADQKDH